MAEMLKSFVRPLLLRVSHLENTNIGFFFQIRSSESKKKLGLKFTGKKFRRMKTHTHTSVLIHCSCPWIQLSSKRKWYIMMIILVETKRVVIYHP